MISLKCSAARPHQTASLWVTPSARQGLPGTAASSRVVPELGVASSPEISLQSNSFTHLDLLLVRRAEWSHIPKDSSRSQGPGRVRGQAYVLWTKTFPAVACQAACKSVIGHPG